MRGTDAQITSTSALPGGLATVTAACRPTLAFEAPVPVTACWRITHVWSRFVVVPATRIEHGTKVDPSAVKFRFATLTFAWTRYRPAGRTNEATRTLVVPSATSAGLEKAKPRVGPPRARADSPAPQSPGSATARRAPVVSA